MGSGLPQFGFPRRFAIDFFVLERRFYRFILGQGWGISRTRGALVTILRIFCSKINSEEQVVRSDQIGSDCLQTIVFMLLIGGLLGRNGERETGGLRNNCGLAGGMEGTLDEMVRDRNCCRFGAVGRSCGLPSRAAN